MRQQDLVWVRLPFSNLQESKVRPAVIISNNDYNKESNDVVVCAVTSNLKPAKYGITISQENLSSGNLPITSKIRADKVLQVEKSLVLRSFARILDSTFDSLIAELLALVKRRKS